MRAQPMILVMLLNTSFMMLLYRVCLKKRAGGDSCEKLACFCLKTMRFNFFFLSKATLTHFWSVLHSSLPRSPAQPQAMSDPGNFNIYIVFILLCIYDTYIHNIYQGNVRSWPFWCIFTKEPFITHKGLSQQNTRLQEILVDIYR